MKFKVGDYVQWIDFDKQSLGLGKIIVIEGGKYGIHWYADNNYPSYIYFLTEIITCCRKVAKEKLPFLKLRYQVKDE